MRVPVAYELSPGTWIPIKWLSPNDMSVEGTHAQYHADLNGGFIEASKLMPPEAVDMVICHEIRHAFWVNCGYGDLFKSLLPGLEEAINEMLDFMYRDTVQINPDSKRFKWKEITDQ